MTCGHACTAFVFFAFAAARVIQQPPSYVHQARLSVALGVDAGKLALAPLEVGHAQRLVVVCRGVRDKRDGDCYGVVSDVCHDGCPF